MVFWLFFLPHNTLIPICALYCSQICSFLFPIFLHILVMILVISYCLESFHFTHACWDSILFSGLKSIIGNMEISWKQKLVGASQATHAVWQSPSMGDDPENRRLHSWRLLFSLILFMAIFIIGIFLGFHDKVTTHLSYAYVSNHNETNSTKN